MKYNPTTQSWGSERKEYAYDKANRLLSEKSHGKTTSYEYNTDGSLNSEQIAGNAKISYSYTKGRLMQRGSAMYTYDNLGNCTKYEGVRLDWYRGNLLKQYGSGEGATSYSYDNQGVRFEKVTGGKTTRYFHDGGKMIDELRGKTRIRYLYDAEELIGFKTGGDYYYYIKDGFGNVRSIVKSCWIVKILNNYYRMKEVARYEYDAWGNCTATAVTDDKIDGESVAEFNPIRWKSQYYDSESGFYYIGGRYYSSETKQYISAANVETVLTNATTIYGLNLYVLTGSNPLEFGGSWYTIATNTELAYDPPKLNAWQQFWQSTVGKVVAGLLVVVALVLCALTGNIGAFLVGMGLTICSLAIGGTIAGYQSYVNGKGFWRGFERYINGNWAQSAAISATLLIVTVGIRTIAAAVAKAGSKQPVANSAKYYDADGQPIWPENYGFVGEPETITLQPGTVVDRYGDATGSFVAPAGTSFEARSLPPDYIKKPIYTYEVIKPIQVKAGITAPWFGQAGGGVQYMFDTKIMYLSDFLKTL